MDKLKVRSPFVSYSGESLLKSTSDNSGSFSNHASGNNYTVIPQAYLTYDTGKIILQEVQDEELIKEVEKSNYKSILTPVFK